MYDSCQKTIILLWKNTEKKRMLVNLYHMRISRKNWDYDVRNRIFKAGDQ